MKIRNVVLGGVSVVAITATTFAGAPTAFVGPGPSRALDDSAQKTVFGPFTNHDNARGPSVKTVRISGKSSLVRWDPCQSAVTVRGNFKALNKKKRARAQSDLRSALSRLKSATKINFVYRGSTSKVPKNQGGRKWYESMPSEIVVSWVKTSSRSGLYSNLLQRKGSKWVAGTGGYVFKQWQANSKSSRYPTIGRGFVVLNASQDKVFRPGFGRGVTRGNLLLHELGHVVGISHTNSKSSIMYPTIISRAKAGYRAVDKPQLRRVGRSSGCHNAPGWVWKHI